MYQFIHIETYARKASTKVKPTNNKYSKAKKDSSAELSSSQRTTHNTPDSNGSGHDAVKKPRANVAGVLGEVMREEGYCSHVDAPQAPNFLYGDEATLRSMPARIELNLEAYEKRHNLKRSIRSDAHVLLAGTATFPRELEQSDPARYIEWRQKTLDYLKKKYGDNLQCVVEHQDEDHPHLHFYVMSAEHVNAKELHDGYIASSAFKSMTNDANDAYNGAMRNFQTNYYEEVGHSCGLLRDGPRRKRMPRDAYKAQQRSESERYELTRKAASTIEYATVKERNASEAMAALLEVKKANGLLLQEATELNADTRRREKELTKAKEDFEALEAKRNAFFQNEEKKLGEYVAATNENASKVRALLKQGQEVKDVLLDPAALSVVQRIKANDTVRTIAFKVAEMDDSELANVSAFFNPPLQPVDTTNQIDPDNLMARVMRGPRYDAPDYS